MCARWFALRVQSTGPTYSRQEEEFAPLPMSIEACSRELEILTHRQEVITNRVKRLTSRLELLIARRDEFSKVTHKSEACSGTGED